MNFLAQVSPWAEIQIGEQLSLFSPMLALVCTMLAIVVCPMIFGRGARVTGAVACLGIIATLILVLRTAGAVADGGLSGLSTDPGAGLLLVDNLSVCFQLILVAFLAGVTWLWWIGRAENERNAPEFFILLIGSALGMALMVSTSNLLMIVVAMETASLPCYAIVGFDKRSKVGAEASLKYVVFGAMCAATMLYGMSLLYGVVGSLNVSTIAAYTVGQLSAGGPSLVLVLGLICFFIGIAFKISAVPFHFWCPDAFEGARTEVTTWLSVVSKAAGLVLLTRLALVFCSAVTGPQAMSVLSPLAWTIGIIATVTCTVGNFSAYRQTSVKRLLAFSSIAHAGYMLMAVAVFVHPDVPGTHLGVTALLAYVVIYMFMNLGAFGITALVEWETGSDKLASFSGLMRRAPGLAIPMIICLVSLVGLPPFAGFIGKWWILVALGSLDSTLGWFLIVVLAVNTLISLYFYMRVVVQMTLRDEREPVLRAPVGGLVLVNVCAVALLVLLFWAAPLKDMTDRFSQHLLRLPVAQVTFEAPPATPVEEVH